MLVERQTPQRMGAIAANEPLAFVDMPGRRNLPGRFQIVIERRRTLFVKPRKFAGIELQRIRFLPSGRRLAFLRRHDLNHEPFDS
jgi:hypothetical protein